MKLAKKVIGQRARPRKPTPPKFIIQIHRSDDGPFYWVLHRGVTLLCRSQNYARIVDVQKSANNMQDYFNDPELLTSALPLEGHQYRHG